MKQEKAIGNYFHITSIAHTHTSIALRPWVNISVTRLHSDCIENHIQGHAYTLTHVHTLTHAHTYPGKHFVLH